MLLFGKSNYQVLNFHVNNFAEFEISTSLFQVRLSNYHCTLKLQNQICGNVYYSKHGKLIRGSPALRSFITITVEPP